MPPRHDPLQGLVERSERDHRQRAGLVPDTVVMGRDCARGIPEQRQAVQEQLNKLHLVVGGISPSAPQGVGTAQFIGTLYRPYVSIFGYSENIRG